MQTFTFPAYIAMMIVLLLCLIGFLFALKRLKRGTATEAQGPRGKRGLSLVGLGSVLLLASVIGLIRIQSSITEGPSFLQPIRSMTAEPVLVLTISGCLVGMTFIGIGIMNLRFGRSLRGA